MKKQHGFGLLEFMLALSLSVFVMDVLFHLLLTVKNTYQQQAVLSTTASRIQFLSQFLSEKIRMTGNWSCQSERPAIKTIMLRRLTARDAKNKLGILIEPQTELLRIRECVRLHNHKQFLPIDFYVADTNRLDQHHDIISALFMKIDDHPREELVSHVTDFQVQLPQKAVLLHYLLSPNQRGVLFVTIRKNDA